MSDPVQGPDTDVPTIVRVVWTVDYAVTFTGELTEDEKDRAIEELMDKCPGDVVFHVGDPFMDDAEDMTAVGWMVEHPHWGDMQMGTLAAGHQETAGRGQAHTDSALPVPATSVSQRRSDGVEIPRISIADAHRARVRRPERAEGSTT